MNAFLTEALFPTVLNMSLTASAVILVVLLARFLLRRAPKVFSYALWAVVLFRLLCPVSLRRASPFSGRWTPRSGRPRRGSAPWSTCPRCVRT